jgi:hypothetical protein
MAVLVDQDRFDVWADYMRDRAVGAMAALTKPELRAAVNAIDVWLNDNAATLNSAIPQPARGALTQAQKALLLNFVIAKRYVKGS